MSRLDPNLMTADERVGEIGLILSRGIARRLKKLKTSQTSDMRGYSLDFPSPGSLHGQSQEEEDSSCKTVY